MRWELRSDETIKESLRAEILDKGENNRIEVTRIPKHSINILLFPYKVLI